MKQWNIFKKTIGIFMSLGLKGILTNYFGSFAHMVFTVPYELKMVLFK
jgi:hypothetical protein